MSPAAELIVFLSTAKERLARVDERRVLQWTEALMAPCSDERERSHHEAAAIAVLIIDHNGIRISALRALFIHGSSACLAVLRGLVAERYLSSEVREAAQLTLHAINNRLGSIPGAVSALEALPGALSRPR